MYRPDKTARNSTAFSVLFGKTTFGLFRKACAQQYKNIRPKVESLW